MQPVKDRVVGLVSRTASSYDKVGPRHFAYFARRSVEFAAVQRGDRVLEVATGAGAVLLLAAEQVGETGRVVGVDLVPAMLGRAEVAVRERVSATWNCESEMRSNWTSGEQRSTW